MCDYRNNPGLALRITGITAVARWRGPAVASRHRRGLVGRPRVSAPEDNVNFVEATVWQDAGYALVIVDARGSGASFGTRDSELATDEIIDYGEVVDRPRWTGRFPTSATG